MNTNWNQQQYRQQGNKTNMKSFGGKTQLQPLEFKQIGVQETSKGRD